MRILTALLLCIVSNSFLQAQTVYKAFKVDFDEARVYLYDGELGYRIVEKGKLDSTIVDTAGYRLSKSELSELDRLLTHPYPDDDTIIHSCDAAACFMPHHGIVFYKNYKIVGEVSICFGCDHIFGDVGIERHCMEYLIPFFESLNLKVNGKVYKPDDDELGYAIKKFNLNRYGEDYFDRRRGLSFETIKRMKKYLKPKDNQQKKP